MLKDTYNNHSPSKRFFDTICQLNKLIAYYIYTAIVNQKSIINTPNSYFLSNSYCPYLLNTGLSSPISTILMSTVMLDESGMFPWSRATTLKRNEPLALITPRWRRSMRLIGFFTLRKKSKDLKARKVKKRWRRTRAKGRNASSQGREKNKWKTPIKCENWIRDF